MNFNKKYKDKEIDMIIKSIIILIDSREKVNSHIRMYLKKNKIKYIEGYKLDFGDYSFMIPKNKPLDILEDIYFNDEIAIERKANAEEISNNFTNNRDRLEREFLRSSNMRLLIEDSGYADICEGNYETKLSKESFVASLHSFNEKYNTPFIFIDKAHSGEYIYNTFKYYLRNQLKNIK